MTQTDLMYCPVCGQPAYNGECDHALPSVGTRVVARGWAPSVAIDDNVTVPPGTTGTILGFGYQQVWVKWDNGAMLAIAQGSQSGRTTVQSDRWEILTKESTT